MYVLRDTSCEVCGVDIIVHGYYDKDLKEAVVDYGECLCCGKKVVLPQDNYKQFVSEFCKRRVGM